MILKNNTIYYETAKAYPKDYRGVHWASKESQFLRFKVLCEISPELFKSDILDVGCGLGHLVDYLIDNEFTGIYKGIDIVHQMILNAKKRHPNFDFETNDIDSVEIENYDYVVASGLFTYVDLPTMQNMISALYSRAAKGLAFNSLSALAKHNEEGMFYPNPSEIFNFCKSITPKLSLIQSYLPNDFTVYMYK